MKEPSRGARYEGQLGVGGCFQREAAGRASSETTLSGDKVAELREAWKAECSSMCVHLR